MRHRSSFTVYVLPHGISGETGRLCVTQAEYNQHVIRCAQMALGLHPADKVTAKASVAGLFAGCRIEMTSTNAQAIAVLRYSAYPHAGDALPPKAMIADVAWAAHLADIRARIDATP